MNAKGVIIVLLLTALIVTVGLHLMATNGFFMHGDP
jgi:hypothetical protein